MSSPENTYFYELREDLVREIIYPEAMEFAPSNETVLSTNNPVSSFLYKPMEVTGSVQIMIEFVDLVGEQIDLDIEPFSESNFLKLSRLLEIITNMPETVPFEEKLKVYDRALESSYIQFLDIVSVFNTAKDLLILTKK